MKCPKCKTEVEKKDRYCPKCGKTVKKWYKRWYMIVLYIIVGIGLIGNLMEETPETEKTATPTDTGAIKEINILITKSPNEMLPTREEIPTEFTIDEENDVNINDIQGLESGRTLSISKLEGYSGYISVDMEVYKFSSNENAKGYYENRVNSVKYERGYIEMGISTRATCFGYTEDLGFTVKSANGLCYKDNIFFMVLGVSDKTLKKSDSYVKDMLSIIDKKVT